MLEIIDYQITLHSASLELEVSYPELTLEKIYFNAPQWNGKPYGDYIPLVSAFNDEGYLDIIAAENQWCVHANQKPFTLSYSFCFPNQLLNQGRFYPLLTESILCLWGFMFLLMPEHKELKKHPVSIGIKSEEPLYFSWPEGYLFTSFYDAQDILIVSGQLEALEQDIESCKTTFLFYGKYDNELPTRLRQIMVEQVQMMGFFPQPKLLVLMANHLSKSHGRGIYVNRGLTLFSNHPSPHQLLHTFAHELFHSWNGHFAYQKAEVEQADIFWFQEGFTDYFAERTLLRGGLISTRDYIDWFNQVIVKVYTDELWSQLSPRQHRQSELLRGNLIAFTLELLSSPVSPGLEELMKKVIQSFSPDTTGYSLQDLESFFFEQKEFTSSSWTLQHLFESLKLQKISLEITVLDVFEIGFQVNTPWLKTSSTIESITPQSNASQTDLKTGDQVLKYRFERYQPNAPFFLKVKDVSGDVKEISYLPSAKRRIWQITGDPSNIKAFNQLYL